MHCHLKCTLVDFDNVFAMRLTFRITMCGRTCERPEPNLLRQISWCLLAQNHGRVKFTAVCRYQGVNDKVERRAHC